MDSEEQTLLLPRKLATDVPKDRGWVVYGIFYLMGIGVLLPWNFFSNAVEYFKFKLRDTNVTSSQYDNSTYESDLQSSFENYLSVAAMVPNVFFMFLNTAVTKLIPLKIRMVMSSLIMILMFAVTVVLTKINTDQWQHGFFVLTLCSIVVMNACSAVLQGGLFGLASMFPEKYTQAVMGGMGMGGTIAAVAMVLAVAVSPRPVETGFGYFLTAAVVIILALVGYLILPTFKFSSHYMQLKSVQSLNASRTYTGDEVTIRSPTSKPPLLKVFKKIKVVAFTVFFTFFVTLSCYPALNSSIVPMYGTKGSPWRERFFIPITCFLTFNACDWIGRSLAAVVQWPHRDSTLLPVFGFLRVAFVPLFMLCNVQPRYHLPVVLGHDFWPIILMVMFGLSNGFLGTLCMMYGTVLVDIDDAEIAGSMMSFFLASGLGGGALISLLVKGLV